MLSQFSSGVQAYILCQVGSRIPAVDNVTVVRNKHLSLSYE
jgi:hypothetical protein